MEHLQDSIAIRDTYYLMKEKEENERGWYYGNKQRTYNRIKKGIYNR
jgi:hypothetical protein